MSKAKENTKRREKFKPLPWLIVIGVIILLCIGISLSYYIQNYRKVYKFEYSNGEYYDKENDITYVSAPLCYTYVLKTEEEYAKSNHQSLYYIGYKVDDKVRMSSPLTLLGTSLENGGVIYYNPEKITIPETKDFSWEIIYLCNAQGVTIATQELDKATTNRLLNAYFDASEEENLYDDGVMGQLKLLKQLRVTSDVYPSLYMIMYLYTDGKGHYFLSSTHDQKLIRTDETVFAPFFEESE